MAATSNAQKKSGRDDHDHCKHDDHDHDRCKHHDHDHDHCKHHDHDHCKHDHDHDHCKHHDSHHRELEKTIKALIELLEHVGRGKQLHELLCIIREPGWTTKAELAFVFAILEHINKDLRALECLQAELVEASWKVGRKCRE